MLQLPIYIPSDEEKNDSLLYAENVRQYMVRLTCLVALLAWWNHIPCGVQCELCSMLTCYRA